MMMLTNYIPTIMRDPFNLKVDRLFNDAVRAVTGTSSLRHVPCDIYEDDEMYAFALAMPGLRKEHVSLTVDNGVVTVVGKWPAHHAESGRIYHVREMWWDAVTRSFMLPNYVDHEKASASFQDGILTISFPKLEEAEPHHILIEEKKAA